MNFPKPYSLGGKVKVELDLSNYATKAKFARKVDLAILKSESDKLDIDKSEKVPTSFNSLMIKVNKC